MNTDEQKIAFITCVNDEEEYEECKFYLNQLSVPRGGVQRRSYQYIRRSFYGCRL